MSRENADRFIAVIDGFNRVARSPGELAAVELEAFLALMDPAIRFAPQQAAIEGGYVGHEGVMRWMADLAQAYETGRFEHDEVRVLGEQVLAFGSLRFVGRGSGIRMDLPVAIVASFRGGLLTDFKDYGDKDAALAAAGAEGDS